jgi:hypothetical protein
VRQLIDAESRQSPNTTCRRQHVLPERQRTTRSGAAAKNQREQLIVAKRFRADAHQFLARTIGGRHPRQRVWLTRTVFADGATLHGI